MRGVGTFGSVEGDIAAVLEAAGAEVDAGIVRALAAEEVAFLRDGVHLYEDSLPVLRELHARGIRTAIVSNCDHATREVVNALGLETEVDAIVLSFEVGALKPDPRIYRAALEALGAAPERAAFVDDQPAYLQGAEALGLRAFLIQREGWEAEDGLPVDRVGLPDLWEVLRALP